jgi:hypothetical protein
MTAICALPSCTGSALNAPGANADQLNIAMLRRMSAALVKLRAAQREELHT